MAMLVAACHGHTRLLMRHCEEAQPTKQSSLWYWIATPLRGSR
jgi:hypothetical protein